MTVTDRLNDIQSRADKATGGEWEMDRGRAWSGIGALDYHATEADWEFIAHARADVPVLIAALRAAVSVGDATVREAVEAALASA